MTPWTVACHAPLYRGFPREEYWNELFPSPGDLPDPGITLTSPVSAGKFFTTVPPGKPLLTTGTNYPIGLIPFLDFTWKGHIGSASSFSVKVEAQKG